MKDIFTERWTECSRWIRCVRENKTLSLPDHSRGRVNKTILPTMSKTMWKFLGGEKIKNNLFLFMTGFLLNGKFNEIESWLAIYTYMFHTRVYNNVSSFVSCHSWLPRNTKVGCETSPLRVLWGYDRSCLPRPQTRQRSRSRPDNLCWLMKSRVDTQYHV